MQRKLVIDAGFGGSGSSAIIEHDVARNLTLPRKRICPQVAALRTVLLDLGLKEAELTDIRKVEGVEWWYLGSSEMTEPKVVAHMHTYYINFSYVFACSDCASQSCLFSIHCQITPSQS